MSQSNDFSYHLMDDEPDFLIETGKAYRSVQNLDKFLAKVYSYYWGKGFWCITVSKVLNLLTLVWIIFFTTFLISSIDYQVLFQSYNLETAISYRGLSPFVVLCLFMCCVFVLWQFVQFLIDLRENWEIKQFYNTDLNISEDELQTIEWRVVVQKLTQIRGLCRTKPEPMTPLDIANRIMRKENYLIAMINKGILALYIPLPYFNKRSIVTKILEWTLSFTIFSYVFDPKNRDGLDRQILDPLKHTQLANTLRLRFKMMGLLGFVLSPFIFVFMSVYFLFKYGEEIRNRPGNSVLATRQWSPMSHWKFRELNELPHVFQRRLHASYALAEEYVSSFPFNMLTIVARFVSFFVGSIVVVLLLIGLWDDDALFQLEVVKGKSALWLIGVGGTVIAACRSFIPETPTVSDPNRVMEQLVQHTHYMPKSWRNKTNSPKVLREFTQLFEYKFVIFFLEMLSVLFAPFVLFFSLADSADDIIRFFREFTVHEPGVGDVCKFAVFPLEEHGNKNYGVDSSCANKHMRTKQGKMEKSFLNFKANYPEWQPSKDGQKYLSSLSNIVSSSIPTTTTTTASTMSNSNMNVNASNNSNINTSNVNNNNAENISGRYGYNSSLYATQSDPLGQSLFLVNPASDVPPQYRVEDSIHSLNLIHRHFYNSRMGGSDPMVTFSTNNNNTNAQKRN